jgi:TIR domain
MHKIFLSYSSKDRRKAEEIALALQAQGNDVFFDKDDLSGGEDFHSVIRERVANADLFVFLISPESVRPGAYTLTELRLVREKWASPKKHVLPVLLEPTDMEAIPAYLKGVTLFEPEGSVAAEVAAHVGRSSRRLAAILIGAAAVAVAIAAFFFYPHLHRLISGGEEPFTQNEALLRNFVSLIIYPSDEIKKTEYSLDPSSSFPRDGRDVVILERITFGRISDDYNAFNIVVAVTNTTASPILLDLTDRFFELQDDQGRKAELLYFCCSAIGEPLGPDQQRQIQLLYRSPSGWEGKTLRARMIYFRISGLLPLLRGTWEFRPLAATAG